MSNLLLVVEGGIGPGGKSSGHNDFDIELTSQALELGVRELLGAD
jgi:hypothetical protein